MPDQHKINLGSYYEQIRTRAYAYLQSHYSVNHDLVNGVDFNHVSKLNPDWTIWSVTVDGESRSYLLFIAIPPTFPDEVPKIYLAKNEFLEIGPTPHVDKDQEICTRDRSLIVINDEQPGRAVGQLLHLAINTLEKGIRGEFKSDFQNEFLAYWNDRSQCGTLLINDIPESTARLVQYKLNPSQFGFSYLIAPSRAFAVKWIDRLGVTCEMTHGMEVLFIDLAAIPTTLPTTFKDVKKLIETISPDAKKALKNFKGQNILTRIKQDTESILFAWNHPEFPCNGFRKGRIPLYLAINNAKSLDKDIVPFQVKRLDRQRLVWRAAAVNAKTDKDFCIAVIGCGSVGSALVMLLAKTGYSMFLLTDPENIEETNVARHLCGCSAAAARMKKVDAVKQTIESHLPYVNCEALPKNCLDILVKNRHVYDVADLLISATGNMAAERRLNDIFVAQGDKPIVYLWLEGYGIAGHILYIVPNNGGCYRCCFNNDGSFKYRVAKDQQINRREAGCQQTYTPYGAIDLELFCAIACKRVIQIIENPPIQSVLTTWIGDRQQFESIGFELREEYVAHSSYTLYNRPVEPLETCPICTRTMKTPGTQMDVTQ